MNITIIHENKSKWNDFKSTYNIKGTPAFISIKMEKLKAIIVGLKKMVLILKCSWNG